MLGAVTSAGLAFLSIGEPIFTRESELDQRGSWAAVPGGPCPHDRTRVPTRTALPGPARVPTAPPMSPRGQRDIPSRPRPAFQVQTHVDTSPVHTDEPNDLAPNALCIKKVCFRDMTKIQNFQRENLTQDALALTNKLCTWGCLLEHRHRKGVSGDSGPPMEPWVACGGSSLGLHNGPGLLLS